MTAPQKFVPAFLSWIDDANEAQNLYFDLAFSYGSEHSSEITTHPVESGANIADHVRVKPLQIKLDVLITNTPIADLPDGSRHGKVASTKLTYPTAEAAAQGPKTLNSYQFSGPNPDYVNDTYTKLWFLHDSHQLLSVTTPIKLYSNLVITSVKFMRDDQASGDAGRFSIELEQLTIVTSDIVDSAVIPEAKKQETVGQTETEQLDSPQEEESVLSHLSNWKNNGLAGLAQ
jgi:hypothetical protein